MRAIVLLVVTIPLGAACFEIGDITVSGSNRVEYWLWQEAEEEVFDDRFDIDIFYKNFLFGFRYQVVEPSNVSLYERREGFYRRYIEYDSRRFGIRAGNYYVTFGRGLLLRAYEDDLAYLDRDIDGVKIRGSTDWGDITLVTGRPRNTEFHQLAYAVINDTTDIIRGADLSLHPLPFFSAGASYVLLVAEKEQFDTSAVFFKRTEVYGTNVSLNIANVDIYGEIAKKWGWDPNLADPQIPFNSGGIGQGYGIYGSASLSFPGYGITVQFADYDSLGLGEEMYRYNSPPILNRYGQSINKGIDETGYQIEAYLSPIEPVNMSLSYSDLKTADDTLFFKESFAEVSYQKSGLLELRAAFDRTEQHGVITGAADWKEAIPKFDGIFYLTQTHSLGVGYQRRLVSGTMEFRDDRLYLSYAFAPYVTVTLTGELRDKELLEEPGNEWRSVHVDWDITQDHKVTLLVGTEKRTFTCSGGVCRYEPSFDGIKAVLISRF